MKLLLLFLALLPIQSIAGSEFLYSGTGTFQISAIDTVFTCDDFTIEQTLIAPREMTLAIHYRCTSPEFAYPVGNDENIFYVWDEANNLLFDGKPIGHIRFRSDGSIEELSTREEDGRKFLFKKENRVWSVVYRYQNSAGDFSNYEARLRVE